MVRSVSSGAEAKESRGEEGSGSKSQSPGVEVSRMDGAFWSNARFTPTVGCSG